jgi:hypothetical protein
MQEVANVMVLQPFQQQVQSQDIRINGLMQAIHQSVKIRYQRRPFVREHIIA